MEASNEAKRAAIDIVNRSGANTFDLAEIQDRVQQAIDTATAKAWEELEIIARSRESWKQIACAAQERLAHQQLGAPTAEGKGLGFEPENIQFKPKARTADVEKDFKEWKKSHNSDCPDSDSDHCAFMCGYGLGHAQVRAPLVADKMRLDWLEAHCFTNREGEREIHYDFRGSLREAIDAALTGTGEKV